MEISDAPAARTAAFGQARAGYAADPGRSRGRLYAEPASPMRSEFQRDRDRVIHSTAFRRLAYKTQVFVFHEGDHYRSRLTHSIEVSQIARSLARALALDEDLAEALGLAHDLGHPPFGHAGEDALAACMSDFGGFDHNAQALRIVTKLEARYAGFNGLNLTWETLEGLVKHNGPVLSPDGAILDYNRRHDLQLANYAGAEAQVAAIADDIAYDAHDIDDGLRAGLFDLDTLRAVPFLADLIEDVDLRWPGLERARRMHELMRRVITRMVEDVVEESRARLAALKPENADAIRRHDAPVAAFSPTMREAERSIKDFLFANMYRRDSVLTVRAQAEQVVRDLFVRFRREPAEMPGEWTSGLQRLDERALSRRVADYIAGMTDRYALLEHRRRFDATPDLR